MVLSNYKVGAGLAVSDMGRAREFYEGKLGLTVSTRGSIHPRLVEPWRWHHRG